MGLYIGSSKRKCVHGASGISSKLTSYSPSLAPTFNGVVLKTSDGYMLLDSNGAVLTAKNN